ncbi:MAG: DUF5658 family protein [Woeseiaceae bacterium]
MRRSIADKRAAVDRRKFSWKTVLFGYFRSRRHNVRRGGDGDVVFLDWHHPWLFFLAVGTMIMSGLDAFLTLQLIDHGMLEANPMMAALLGRGTAAFAASKMLMTGTSILILVFLAKTRFLNRMRAGILLTVFFSAYACLVCYEFVQLLGMT